MKKSFRLLFGGLFLAGLALAPRTSSASNLEPANNSPPWANWATQSDTTVYVDNYSYEWGWSGFESISSSTDVDYVLLACANGNVTMVGINIPSGVGDLDIDAYTVIGTPVGSSHGTGSTERIYPSIAKQAIFLKVYLYSGATGGYDIRVLCG